MQAGLAAGKVLPRIQQDTCRCGGGPEAAVCCCQPGINPSRRTGWVNRLCHSCFVVAQGKRHGRAQLRRWLAHALAAVALAGAVFPAAARCLGLTQPLQPLAPGVWWLPSATGDSHAANRGQVSNLVLVRQGHGAGARLWALGTGPSPAFGRALACQVRRQLGTRVTDAISPWARPELVLGVAGLRRAGPLRHWAHASVAQAMAANCPHCVDRLRLRLGTAAADLGDQPISLPDQLLQGAQGRLGPFDWWLLPRTRGRGLTVWRLALPGQPVLWLAHGLLQGDGPPDGRDADLALLQQSSQQLAALAAGDGPAVRFMPEQGPLLAAGAPAQHARYWAGLLAAAEAAVLRGDDETAPPPVWPGLPAGWAGAPWQALNWQHAWREAEEAVLSAPPTPAPAASAP